MALSVANLSVYPPLGTSVDSAGTGLSGFSSYPYTPGGNVFVVGFIDGEQKAKFFYVNNTTSAVVPLPTLVKITQIVSPADPAGNTRTDGFLVTVLPGTGTGGISPDSSSPSTYYLDPNAMLIIASTNVG